MPLPEVVETFGLKAVMRGAAQWFQAVSGTKIKITHPRPMGVLDDRQTVRGGGYCYAVRGTLKRLPIDNMIWLLVEEQGGLRAWPQGFHPVVYDPGIKEWHGRISDERTNMLIKIVAVVAPPTSQDFFSYYERAGLATGYMALERVPPECKNRDYVQVYVPA